MKKRILLTIGTALALLLTACGGSSSSDRKEADLPYGATMLTDTESGNVPITYDRRFISAEEAKTLSDYFYAVQSKDEKLLAETTLPLYMDFVVDSLYQGLLGMDGLVTDMNSKFAAEEDTDYVIKEVEIKSYYTSADEESSDLANLYNMLSELSGEQNYAAKHITDGKFITYSIRTDTDGTVKNFEEQTLFLILADGKYVVCS